MKRSRSSRKKITLADFVKAAHKAGMTFSPMLTPGERVPMSNRMVMDLNKLVQTGFYGHDRSDAARRLLEEALISKQWLINPK